MQRVTYICDLCWQEIPQRTKEDELRPMRISTSLPHLTRNPLDDVAGNSTITAPGEFFQPEVCQDCQRSVSTALSVILPVLQKGKQKFHIMVEGKA